MKSNAATVPHREYGRKDASERADDMAEFKSVMTALTQRDNEIKTFAEKASAEIKDHGKILVDTKAVLEKLAREGGDLQARLMDVEQKLARRAGNDNVPSQSLGMQFTESADFKELAQRKSGSARLNVKAVTSVTSLTTGTGGVGDAIRPQRLPGIIAPPDRPMTVRDLLMPGRTDSNSVEYVKETGFQNNAAPVAETTGDPTSAPEKPQSDLSFELVQTPVRTIAHHIIASKQVLADVPLLQSYIDGRLRYGLTYVEEAQLLMGDGTGQNLLGLIPQATDFDDSRNQLTDTRIDILRRAILQVRIAEYRASAIVLNPADFAEIELTKDSTGWYIWVNVQTGGTQQLWRLPVIDTNAMPEGEFMVGAFNIAAQVFDREEGSVEVATQHKDFFTKNLVAILAEERIALAVFRPQSFVHGAFPGGASP
jgi:HK97 family phage major capsid protein